MSNKIDEEVTCPICQDILRKPIRILLCGHNFCQPCLENLFTMTSTETRCPNCRASVSSANGMEAFPRNRTLENVIEKMALVPAQEVANTSSQPEQMQEIRSPNASSYTLDSFRRSAPSLSWSSDDNDDELLFREASQLPLSSQLDSPVLRRSGEFSSISQSPSGSFTSRRWRNRSSSPTYSNLQSTRYSPPPRSPSSSSWRQRHESRSPSPTYSDLSEPHEHSYSSRYLASSLSSSTSSIPPLWSSPPSSQNVDSSDENDLFSVSPIRILSLSELLQSLHESSSSSSSSSSYDEFPYFKRPYDCSPLPSPTNSNFSWSYESNSSS
ncbi:unnamed protein product [Clavelina lepadiformis]|uniref:RING-type domain-containing protein n=1 Tax=Clavelina lepadiformis TaxID=159417 RepID=A0ABP0EVA9_CLALP